MTLLFLRYLETAKKSWNPETLRASPSLPALELSAGISRVAQWPSGIHLIETNDLGMGCSQNATRGRGLRRPENRDILVVRVVRSRENQMK